MLRSLGGRLSLGSFPRAIGASSPQMVKHACSFSPLSVSSAAAGSLRSGPLRASLFPVGVETRVKPAAKAGGLDMFGKVVLKEVLVFCSVLVSVASHVRFERAYQGCS